MPPPPLPLPRRVALVSYRLGVADGVSIEAAKWVGAFGQLGAEVTTVAGSGVADRLVAGLAADATVGPDRRSLEAAIEGVDLVVVENCLSLPLNERSGRVLAELLAGRPAIVRHHDLPWQRPHYREAPPPPDDAAWWHVTINERSRLELAAHGIRAVTFYNSFDPDVPPGEREATRRVLGVQGDEVLVLQPTRAIPRKNVPGGVLFSRALGATYWLLGAAEDGYGPELARILAQAGVPVLRGLPDGRSVADAYAACDVVVLPSTFEGFGNPSVESALYRRPLAIGAYPVAAELRRFGFSWFDASDPAAAAGDVARWLANPDPRLLDRNEQVARTRFSSRDLPDRLRRLVTSG
ncbi:MAG TPA: glycosyltransferase [Acidimicrobiales bacterium]|nr:glycosyltransferase [Acidimicrobiales bacterium]